MPTPRLHPRRLLWSVVALLMTVACQPSDEPPPALRVPGANVVLVTIDTLRADHLGCYGYERDTSPSIDRIAGEGMRFDLAFSQRGLTLPALASIMTSEHVYSHGVVGMYQARLDDRQQTLAEALQAAGYRTVAFTSHLGIARNTGFDQGFDEYKLFHSRDEWKMARGAARWMYEHRHEPFFLWYHSFGPHSPYQAPGPWRDRYTDPGYDGEYDGDQEQMYFIGKRKELADADREHLIALYDAKVRWIDFHLGHVLRKLDTAGLAERTLLLVTADHGEELFDHFLYFSHEASIFDGVLRIPLIARLPGRIPAGSVVDDQVVQQIDFAPTILDVVGAPRQASHQGHSLAPILAGAAAPAAGVAFGSVDLLKREGVAIHTARTGRWRFVRNRTGYVPGWNITYAPTELYDLTRDPKELHNVASGHPDVVADLDRRIDGWLAATQPAEASESAPTAPDVAERLRALGYVEDEAERGAQAPPDAP